MEVLIMMGMLGLFSVGSVVLMVVILWAFKVEPEDKQKNKRRCKLWK